MSNASASIRRLHLAACAKEPGWVFCSACGGEDPDCFECDGQGGWHDQSPARDDLEEPGENQIEVMPVPEHLGEFVTLIDEARAALNRVTGIGLAELPTDSFLDGCEADGQD